MPFLDQLKETWPIENIEPFGEVVVIPAKAFKEEWKEQLLSVKIYAQAYHGEACLFLKEKNGIESKQEEIEHKPELIPRKSKRHWTQEEDEELRQLYEERGLSIHVISKNMDCCPQTIRNHITQLGLSDSQTHTEAENLKTQDMTSINEDSLVKELLAASAQLYPNYRRVCSMLLRQASEKILIDK